MGIINQGSNWRKQVSGVLICMMIYLEEKSLKINKFNSNFKIIDERTIAQQKALAQINLQG